MNFNCLPEPAQIQVLSFLNVKERLEIKLVSKAVKTLIEQYFPLKSLCVYVRGKPAKVRWAFDKEAITDSEKVEVHFQSESNKKQYYFDFDKIYFENLKRLHIQGDCGYGNGMGWLKCIRFLKELEILSVYDIKFPYPNIIRSPMLKVFTFKNPSVFDDFQAVFELVTPNLREYNIISLNEPRTKFENPEKLEVLRCHTFGYKYPINRFTSLRHLVCRNVDNSVRPEHLRSLELIEAFPTDSNTIEKLRNKEFTKDVKVFVFGFDLKNLPRVFTEIHPDQLLKQIAANYASLEKPCYWTEVLNYSELSKVFGGQAPIDYFKFYPNIREVTVSEITNYCSLNHFLVNCGDIKKLYLEKNCVDQQFFNGLKTISGSLNVLYITWYTLKIDFSFLSELTNLKTLVFWSSKIRWKLIGLESLEQCKILDYFEFKTPRFSVNLKFDKYTKIYFLDFKRKQIYEGPSLRKAIACLNSESESESKNEFSSNLSLLRR